MAVIKSLARHSATYGSLIDYLLKEGKGKDGKPVMLTQNIRGTTKEEFVRAFIENESFRQHAHSRAIFMYHEIISLSSKENGEQITREVMEDLARRYMELRGRDTVSLASLHEDREHAHIHLMTSGVKFRTGLAARMSRQEFHELKMNFQQYHEKNYPFLTHSSPEHGKLRDYPGKQKREAIKGSIHEKVQQLYQQAESKEHLLTLLREEGWHHYERNGIPTGLIAEDVKFRFSSLDIEKEHWERLPDDRTEEQQTLDEIHALRERRNDMERDMDREL